VIAGIDFNTKSVDVVLLSEHDNHADWIHRDFHGQDAFDRARAVRDAMPSRGWWEDAGVLALFIEEPRGKGKVDASTLFRVQGAILATLPPALAVGPLMPHQWKPKCGLKGNAKKWEIDSFAHKAWINRPPDANQDSHDAFAIAYAGRQLYEVSAIQIGSSAPMSEGGELIKASGQ
jgi:hypothetical protein